MKKEKTNHGNSSGLRRKAEQRLNSAIEKLGELPDEKTTDIKKLVHELEVHQIELEMQNDDLRKAQLKIEETRQKYFNLYNFAPVGYLTLNERGFVLDLNLTAAGLLGIDKSSLINSRFYNKIDSADRDIFYRHLAQVWKKKNKQSCELKLLKKDGAGFYCQLISVPMQDEKNNVLNCRTAVMDITERKLMAEALRISEEKHRNLFETMAQGVVYQDVKGNIIAANPAAERILGLSLDQMLGLTSLDPCWHAISEDGSEFPGDAHPSIVALRTGKEVRNVIMGVFNPQIDQYLWIYTNAIPQFKQGEKKPYQVYTTFEDVTERKQAEEKIKINREHLKILYKILRHDLANDFVVIKSTIGLYKKTSDRKILDEIEKRVIKSLNTIKRLRDHEAFIDSHSLLNECNIKRVVEALMKDHPEMEIQVEGSGTAFADEAIYSVFENLANNAIIHGKTKKINITISSDEKYCEIRFKDFGIGIPDKIKDKIFDEDFIYGQNGHTGIGLYIVRQTIESYGGTIYLESNDPEGTIFIIRLRKVL